MEQIDLNNKSLTELKALAYDQLAVREQAQQNLNVLNERITRLLQNPATKEGELEVAEETSEETTE